MGELQDRRSEHKSQGISRRRFIGWTLLGSLAATIGGVLTPIIAYLWPPPQASAGTELKVDVGTVDEFPLDSGKVVSVANKPVIVVNTDQGGLKAFSAICTHLGCIVYWHEQRRLIQCPCHDGRFNPLNGNVILGPPPAPLAEYRLEVEGDTVYIEPGGEV
jgi:cytochrome b6-f complex iron-sulfur subunit